MANKLHLHPHKHTGKLLHHKHTSYHALFLLLAIAGAFMVTMNHMAKAADYQVTAIVPAPLPSGTAQITSPHDGDTVYDSTTILSGTCPVSTPAIIVVAYSDGTLLGSQTCSAQGMFNLPVSFVTAGPHSVVLTVMNFTGQIGASSTPINITYVPTNPLVETSTVVTYTKATSSSGGATKAARPMPDTGSQPKIIIDTAFIAYSPGKDAVWTADFESGTPPYHVTIMWGDGTTQAEQNVQPGKHSYSHSYNVPGTYNVRVVLVDKNKHTATDMFTAICPAAFRTLPATIQSRPSLLPYLYGAYLLVIAVLLQMWYRHRLLYVHKMAYIPVGAKRRNQHKSR